MSVWSWGVGRYSKVGIFVVTGRHTEQLMTFIYGQKLGNVRRVTRRGDKLVLPQLCLEGGKILPEIVFTSGMSGYWQMDEGGLYIFADQLPEGGVLCDSAIHSPAQEDAAAPTETRSREVVVAEACATLADEFDFLRGSSRALVFVTKGGKPSAFIPDPEAPVGSVRRRVADFMAQLGPDAAKIVIGKLRNLGRATIDCKPLYHTGLMRDNLFLNRSADAWLCLVDGRETEVCDYRKGDETINLRELAANGLAVCLSMNVVRGPMVEVIGILTRSDPAFTGRDSDPFKFVVPVKPGGQSSVHVVVRHENERGSTYAVYGFTVARRSDAQALAEAERLSLERGEQVNPALVPTRRAVDFAGSRKPCYFVFPDGQRILYLLPS